MEPRTDYTELDALAKTFGFVPTDRPGVYTHERIVGMEFDLSAVNPTPVDLICTLFLAGRDHGMRQVRQEFRLLLGVGDLN